MARMKLCRCGLLIEHNESYCKECTEKVGAERKEYHKTYDKYSRDKDSVEFYNSYEWQRVRQYILSKYRGLDLYAFFIDNEILYADTVHHIEELRGCWHKRITIGNLFPLTAGNHSKIHKLYEKDIKVTQKLLISLLKKWEQMYG